MTGQLDELAGKIAQVSDIYAAHFKIDRSGDWYLPVSYTHLTLPTKA